MDNITHTAVGALFTEWIYQRTTKTSGPNPGLRKKLHILSALASNFPDLDLLMQIIDPTNLGYLINHRGHSHTIPGLIFQFILLFSFAFLYSKFKRSPKNSHFSCFQIVAAFGLFSHVALDFLNSYGVHPFWPVYNSWYYGDSLFIIEPLFWITASLSFFHILKTGIFRYLFLSIALLAPIIFLYVELTTVLIVCGVYAFTCALYFHLKGQTEVKLARNGLKVVFCIICLFALQSFSAKKHLRKTLPQITNLSSESLVDLVTMPLPSNFLCWRFLALFKDQTDATNKKYVVHSGVYSPLNMTLYTCLIDGIPQNKTALKNTDHIEFYGRYTTSLKDLQEVADLNCQTRAWFTHARVPLIKNGFVEDLRYTNKSRKNFTQLELKADGESTTCPVVKSPWTPPRKGLITPEKL